MEYSKELRESIVELMKSWDEELKKRGAYAVSYPITLDEIQCLFNEIDRITKLHEWIPVSERLPKNNEVVLLWDRVSSLMFVAQFHQFKKYSVWYIDGDENRVTYCQNQYNLWQPIPLPPQEQP
jgi:hypothetical protein